MSLVVVTGKGGVGKSTVAAALALGAAADGRDTAVVEVAGRTDVHRGLTGSRPADPHVEREVAPRLTHVTIDSRHALIDYLREEVPRPAAALLRASGVFALVAAATPGLAELLTIGKVWRLAQDHDLVVLDAPASGHAVALMRAPGTFAATARTGPVAGQARRIDGYVRDPACTEVIAVAAAEEMAVHETLELRAALRDGLGLDLRRVIVDEILPDRFSAAELAAIERLAPSRARRAALAAGARAGEQRAQLEQLRAALDGLPVATLPFVFEPEIGPRELQRLAALLAAARPAARRTAPLTRPRR